MKKYFFMVILLSVIAAIVWRFDSATQVLAPITSTSTIVASSSTVIETSDILLDQRIASMSMEEKIGQLFLVGIPDFSLSTTTRVFLRDSHIGGVILYKRNIQSAAQVRTLNTTLQSISSREPLFIGVDQEGGAVVRLPFLKETTPQSAIKTTKQAQDIGLSRAKELANLGINMNFAPVIDYVPDMSSYLYGRTFMTDATTTGLLGRTMVEGYEQGGVIPVAKHFPGYGSLMVDPHKTVSVLSVDQKALQQSLLPFQLLIDAHPTATLMTAHITIPSVDTKPATRSKIFLQELLRDQMGFRGVIVTDDLEMVAAGDSIEEAAKESFLAGADVLLIGHSIVKQKQAVEGFTRAVHAGEISEQRLNESVKRILRAKSGLAK